MLFKFLDELIKKSKCYSQVPHLSDNRYSGSLTANSKLHNKLRKKIKKGFKSLKAFEKVWPKCYWYIV